MSGLYRRAAAAVFTAALIPSFVAPSTTLASAARPKSSHEAYPPAVLTMQVVRASRVASILHEIYPGASIRVDSSTNSVIVVAPPDVVNGMRAIASGIDVHNPTDSVVDTVQVHNVSAEDAVAHLRPVFARARFTAASNRTILIVATPADLTQIKSVVATMDTAPPTPTPRPAYPTVAVQVTQGNAKAIARVVAKAAPSVRVAVSHGSILLSGPPDTVQQAQTLIGQLDAPQQGVQYTQVYHLHYVDARSVADLIRRSYPRISVQTDDQLNAVTILADSKFQRRIGDAIAQLDAAPPGAPGASGAGGGGGVSSEVITLRAAVPGLNGAPSTSSSDIATTVTQALSGAAPDLKVTVVPNSSQLVLTGSDYSIKMAKDLIDQLDVAMPLVVLDTEVYEVDSNASKNLGLEFSSPVISSNFTEQTPPVDFNGNVPPLMGLHGFTRTALSFTAQLNLLLQRGQGKVLADPRITTISGRTASIRAGDTISILTTAGGGSGTVATTQVQQFQTGVSLDITPVVNAGGFITVTLHPTVNSLEGFNNGVPQIATRDTTTTVGLQADQTLIIGGLIQDSQTSTSTRIPILGDLPLVGHIFRSDSLQYQRNEVIVTVTPHLIEPGQANFDSGRGLPPIPTPQPLPTLPPGTRLPPPSDAHLPTPAPYLTPPPSYQVPGVTPSGPSPMPTSTPTPAAPALASTPAPLPTAFNQTNVYTYGAAPQNNYVAPGSAPQIFYVQVSPTVVKSGTPVTISAITTTNVSELDFGYTATGASTRLTSIGPGQWQGTFPFSMAGLPGNYGNVQMMLAAKTTLGGLVTVPIPMSIAQ